MKLWQGKTTTALIVMLGGFTIEEHHHMRVDPEFKRLIEKRQIELAQVGIIVSQRELTKRFTKELEKY